MTKVISDTDLLTLEKSYSFGLLCMSFTGTCINFCVCSSFSLVLGWDVGFDCINS